ncbi:hypothetical protein GCM10023322_38410 [Rugosimonospora acidiphila]|uniref:Uncharacterized protein n=1 Tax=Rugosimonospora acidiphila TaxID=556531 RepID=A0ABP9RVX4_9ACTN
MYRQASVSLRQLMSRSEASLRARGLLRHAPLTQKWVIRPDRRRY